MNTTNYLNWGKKIGVLTPATNLSLEEELWSMRVTEATLVTARIVIDQIKWETDKDVEKFVKGVTQEIIPTAHRAVQAAPDFLLLGISISNLWGGLDNNQQIKQQIKKEFSLEIVTPVDALIEVLKNHLRVQSISVLTPYPEIADDKVVNFFKELDIEVVAQKGLRIKSPKEIACVSQEELRLALEEINVDKAQAIVQLGTDLHMARLADEAERWLNKPTIAVNAATWWLALRKHGINAQISGFGSLLRNN